jgi:hypothetical protein
MREGGLETKAYRSCILVDGPIGHRLIGGQGRGGS